MKIKMKRMNWNERYLYDGIEYTNNVKEGHEGREGGRCEYLFGQKSKHSTMVELKAHPLQNCKYINIKCR